jgi:glutathione S-transferase
MFHDPHFASDPSLVQSGIFDNKRAAFRRLRSRGLSPQTSCTPTSPKTFYGERAATAVSLFTYPRKHPEGAPPSIESDLISMIIVHHLNNSRSQRVLWLLEELGVEYEVKRYERDPKTMLAPASLRAAHPLGKSPVVTENGLTLAESGAIVEYLIERHGRGGLIPAAGTPERLRYTYWLHYAEGSAMPPLLLSLIFGRLPRQPMPFFVRPIARGICDKVLETFVAPQLKVHQEFMEGELQKSTWFAGEEFSAADIQMSFVVEASAARGGLDQSRPKLIAWLERIRGRPAYKRALEKGGVYELLH